MIEIMLNLVSIYAVILVIYGLMIEYINKYLSIFTDILIFICAFTIVYSVFLPVNTRDPEIISTNITAPIVLISLVLLFLYWGYSRKNLPEICIKGISLLGMSGALFRLVSY